MPIHRFSTDIVPSPQRYDAWRGQALPTIGQVFETKLLEPFGFAGATTVLEDVPLAFSRHSSKEWYRTPDLIRANNLDMIAANIRFRGEADGEASGDAFFAPGGSTMFIDLARPQGHRSAASHTALLLIPRAVAEEVLGPAEKLHGLVVSSAQSALVRAYLRELERAIATMSANQAPRLRQAALDLLAVAVSQALGGTAPPARAIALAARRRTEAIIEDKLGFATLSVTTLCGWARVSRSTLYRLFEEDGGVQAYIRARRLERVEEELRRGARSQISDIAERWGFCDAAYLARLFREEHGLSPGEYRALYGAEPEDGAT